MLYASCSSRADVFHYFMYSRCTHLLHCCFLSFRFVFQDIRGQVDALASRHYVFAVFFHSLMCSVLRVLVCLILTDRQIIISASHNVHQCNRFAAEDSQSYYILRACVCICVQCVLLHHFEPRAGILV